MFSFKYEQRQYCLFKRPFGKSIYMYIGQGICVSTDNVNYSIYNYCNYSPLLIVFTNSLVSIKHQNDFKRLNVLV